MRSQIHQFYMSMMALRRNPQRKCKKEEAPGSSGDLLEAKMEETEMERPEPILAPRAIQYVKAGKITLAGLIFQRRRPAIRYQIHRNAMEPFRFFDLPREVRDHVYSYLVVRRGRKVPIIEAKAILRGQKKRANAQRTRERLNQKRAQSGRRPITPREPPVEPIVHLNILQASALLRYEANDYMYQNNWFALSLDNFPITLIDTPSGWSFDRIARMQLELQLKDAQRMNSYVDWGTFFASFPALRFLRIIPTFHPRYYDWAQAELTTWAEAHFIFRAFFRELLVAIPEAIHLKLGPSLDTEENMLLEGRDHVSRLTLQEMYTELGARRGADGRYLAVNRVVECSMSEK